MRSVLALACLVSACAGQNGAPPNQGAAIDTDPATLQAVRETAPVSTPGDAADDPAVWRNPVDPAKSLIVATDKEWGLGVYDLTGALVAATPAGRVNNVDLRADVMIGGARGILVAASDRSTDPDGKIALYVLETGPVRLRHLADVPVESDGVGEVYGFCLWRSAANQIFAFVPFNDGDVRQYALDFSDAVPRARLVREFKFDSQTEGCVADDRTGLLYVAEERRGIWRVGADPDAQDAPVLFAAVDASRLVPDIEGLAIVPRGATGGFLIASSQADNPGTGSDRPPSAYVAYDLDSMRFVRRFRVVGNGNVDGATDTDGIEFAAGDFGAPFSHGILVVQDGDNAPDHQNFKLVPGGALKRLLPINRPQKKRGRL